LNAVKKTAHRLSSPLMAAGIVAATANILIVVYVPRQSRDPKKEREREVTTVSALLTGTAKRSAGHREHSARVIL
jgi:hypothetical protein